MPQLQLTLVIGGTASGKSQLAERLAGAYGPSVVYLASGSAGDAEMAHRIAAHRRRRPDSWVTVEAATNLADALEPHLTGAHVVLLDDLGFVVTAVLLEVGRLRLAEQRLRQEERDLWRLVRERSLPLVAVSSEVGLSLVPTTSIGRSFGDILGRANQRWSARAQCVYLVVAGQQIMLKGD